MKETELKTDGKCRINARSGVVNTEIISYKIAFNISSNYLKSDKPSIGFLF